MNGWPGRPVLLAAAAATAALAIAGCGGSPVSSGGSGPQPSGGSTPAATLSGSPGGSTATVAYFPAAAGDTWVYKQTAGGGTGRTTDKMTAVRPTPAGEQVTMTHTSSYPVATTTKETLLFRPDGSVEVPLTQFGSTSVTITSGGVIWPSAASLAAGQSQTSTIVMKVKQGGRARTVTLPVTVKGEGSATVTVPAGTYHASVIGETMSMGVRGFKVSITVRTWVADGVGPVKSEAFTGLSGNAVPVSSEELVSFTKG